MFYYQPEKKPENNLFYAVCVEENLDGSWAYTRRTAGGLTLKTTNIEYFFHGAKLGKGTKNEDLCSKKCRDMNYKAGYVSPNHIM